MRQSPVGEPAATAAANFATPRRRNSAKRFCLVRHCRQRYKRNLRRIHASRFVRTSRSLAEAEVAAPSYDVWLQLFDQLLQTEPPCPTCDVSDPPLEFVERLWRDAPLAPVIRDAEPKKLALFRSRHRALRLVDLEPQLVGQEPAHRGHDPFAGAMAANIDVAVVGVPAKTVTASGQFLVEVVKHEIAKDGRKHSPNAKGNLRPPSAICRLRAARFRAAAFSGATGSSAGSRWCHCPPGCL